MEHLQDMASVMYDDIPPDCFNAKVPLHVFKYPDNEVIPFSWSVRTQEGGSTKWIRASKFDPFVASCRTYGRTEAAPILPSSLHVTVMVYMPLRDAYQLHGLMQDSDILPVGKLTVDAQPQVEPYVLPMEVEMQCPDEKVGYIQPNAEHDLSIGFTVVNYNLLWSKANQYLQRFINDIDICTDVLAGRPSPDLESLEAALDDAKKMLIFIMYNRNIPEAHNVLLEMFPEVHNTVYLDCQHCQHPDAAVVHEDSPETVARLNEALENLGYQDYDLHHSVEAAQYNLMAVKGRLEYGKHYQSASVAFALARKEFSDALKPIIHNMTMAVKKLTLMGVPSDGEDGLFELN
ncbi:uncharacterized protein [Triticum aestivum]|nr:uncharacterized protein LOC123190086 isoform X2 [Triticum aestivum]XP_044458597.1 uncharacterized protein LOC123190086 isoform X2 [Triticum aestivum]XP_044458598.1 uncharacterized protein LOC123190086 isoform X2 [Triticum aestivum]